jgi:hypothetical protein
MLNACTDSWAAGKLMDRMERAGVQPSEVTFQKLYKIFLRDARVKEAGVYVCVYYVCLYIVFPDNDLDEHEEPEGCTNM